MSEGVKWNLDSYFPEFLGKEMLQFKNEMTADINKLKEFAEKLSPLSTNNMNEWEKLLLDNEELSKRLSQPSYSPPHLCANFLKKKLEKF